MRRIICLALAMLISLSLACPVFAASTFTPSVTYKDTPAIVRIKDNNGNWALGLTRDATGKVTGYIGLDCLLLTSVAEASKDSSKLDKEAREELLNVYNQLKDGTMKLPYADLGMNENKTVIRDLFDASWLCVNKTDLSDHVDHKNHKEQLDVDGVVMELKLKLGVGKNDKVYVLTYNDGKWSQIKNVVNNGDGTVTCTFEHLCPVAICVDKATIGSNPKTGDAFGQNLGLWVALVVVSAGALTAIVVLNKKKKN